MSVIINGGKIVVSSGGHLSDSCNWKGVQFASCSSSNPIIELVGLGSQKTLDSNYTTLASIKICRMISKSPIRFVVLGYINEYDSEMGAVRDNAYVYCYNEDMDEIWTLKLSRPDTTSHTFYCTDGISDSSGNLYVCGYWQGGTSETSRAAFHKIDNNGNVSNNYLTVYSQYDNIDYDSSEDVWTSGWENTGSTAYKIYKNATAQYTITKQATALNIAISGTVYYALTSTSSAVDTIFVGGSADSYRATTNASEQILSLTTDNSGYIYASAYDNTNFLRHTKIDPADGSEVWNNTSNSNVQRTEYDGEGNLANRQAGFHAVDVKTLNWLKGDDGTVISGGHAYCGGDLLNIMGHWPVLNKATS